MAQNEGHVPLTYAKTQLFQTFQCGAHYTLYGRVPQSTSCVYDVYIYIYCICVYHRLFVYDFVWPDLTPDALQFDMYVMRII